MERIYYQGTPAQCERAFKELCAQNPKAGFIPRTGGLIPELPMLDQIIYPGLIAGWKRQELMDRLQAISPVPVHRLHDLPGRSNDRVRAWAALLRVLLQGPELILANGFFEEQEPQLLAQFLSLLPQDTGLVCLGTQAPQTEVLRCERLIDTRRIP